jgi:hypothetical protein
MVRLADDLSAVRCREHCKERERKHDREPGQQQKAFRSVFFELLPFDVSLGLPLRRPLHDLPELRRPSVWLRLVQLCRLSFNLVFDLDIFVAALCRFDSPRCVIGLHGLNLLENC